VSLKPVEEVREWRKKMVEKWKGKSREEIRRELNKAAEDFRREVEEEQRGHTTGAA
jgi:hypothetical protein